MKCFVTHLIIVLSFHRLVNGANVLFLSNVPSTSHSLWCKSLLESLHERGHNITALSPEVESSKANLTYFHLEEVYPTFYNGSAAADFLEIGKKSPAAMYLGFAQMNVESCSAALNSKGYQQLLSYPNDFKVDLVIHDSTVSNCLLGLVVKFHYPPLVAVNPFLFSVRIAQLSGAPVFPAFYPSPWLPLSQKMSLSQRFSAAFQTVFEFSVDSYIDSAKINEIAHNHHPDIPHLWEIEKRVTKLILVNTQPLTDHKQPTLPSVKLVGGVQIRKPKALPEELKEIADNSEEGLVLFSLGTNVRSDTLGLERIRKIVKAFGRLPKYTFLWKFETEIALPVELPKNVKVKSWIPQNDVLAHKNTKLFISHCGLLSIQESLWYGVPVLGFPVFADQPQNALRLKNLGVGEVLSIYDFSEEELFNTLKNLLEDEKYHKKVRAFSSALRDQPMTPLEEATYWSEWVIRHPGIELSSPSVDSNLFVLHSFDIIALLLILVFVIFILFIKFTKVLTKTCIQRMKSNVKKNKIQ